MFGEAVETRQQVDILQEGPELAWCWCFLVRTLKQLLAAAAEFVIRKHAVVVSVHLVEQLLNLHNGLWYTTRDALFYR
jgi:hypothetical protein